MRALRVLAVLLLIILAGAGGVWSYFDQAATSPIDPRADEGIIFEVPKGATLYKVGSLLVANGFVRSDLVFKVYLKTHPKVPAPKAGKHELKRSMNLPEILAALSENPISDDVPLTMVEGLRLRDWDADLASKGLIEPGAYLEAASDKSRFSVPFEIEGDSLAGYLLPETYMVPPGKLDVNKLIQRQIDAFHERFVKPHADEIEKSGRSLKTLVVMASMLEKEEPRPKNKPAVAGVLYKRLDTGHALGVDATSRYTLENWNDRKAFLKKLRDPEDPYNTRLRTGLPPGPISTPSLDSLLAALRPKMGPFWYYLHDDDANIHFARTAEEHEANRRRYNVY